MASTSIVIPNLNGGDRLAKCMDSLFEQSLDAEIIVVDNASTDNSCSLVEEKYPKVILLKNQSNLGFAGGVNTGIRYAMENGAKYIALLNNDAVADKNWLKNLVNFLDNHPEAGIATSKIVDSSKKFIDSTGDLYTAWGLPYPRGRREPVSDKYDKDIWVFGASGGASLYRSGMLKQIGLFDEDFFAYYEDVDLSFRAQLAGWLIAYVPKAVVYHEIGATSSQIKDFATYHTLKNLPWLLWKNLPWRLMPRVWLRFELAYSLIAFRALSRGQFGAFFKAMLVGTLLWPKKLSQRSKIQKNCKVSLEYINSIITPDLPPNAIKLRSLRSQWWNLTRKN